MQNEEITVDLDIITLALEAPQDVIKLFFQYFPSAIKFDSKNSSGKSHYHMIFDLMEKKCMVPPEGAKKIKNFSGVSYWFWESGKECYALSTKEYDNSLHMVVRKDRDIIVYFPMESQMTDEDQTWFVRVFRELYLYEAIRQGMLPFHASGIVYKNNSTVFIGDKNAGKTTSLFACVEGFGAYPLSNDLVLIGERNNELWSYGWPLSLTIGNTLLMNAGKKSLICTEVEKTRFFPNEFTQIFQTEWIWSAKLENIVFPCVNLNQNAFCIKEEEYESAKAKIAASFLNFSRENIVGMQIDPISLSGLLEIFKKKLRFLSMEGDIWKNAFQLKQALQKNNH